MVKPWRVLVPPLGGILFLVLLGAPVAPAQSVPGSPYRRGCPIDPETAPRPEAYALRIDSPIRLDGRLDEATWEQAQPLTGFVQNKPNPGCPATEETVVRILYDDEKLYIGAILYDSKFDKITANSLKREFPSGEEDTFGVLFDTFLDRRNGFMFGVNPKAPCVMARSPTTAGTSTLPGMG